MENENIQIDTYFCHNCTRTIESFPTDDFVCPSCNSDLIEIMSNDFYKDNNLPTECDESESDSDSESDIYLLIPEPIMERLLHQLHENVTTNTQESRNAEMTDEEIDNLLLQLLDDLEDDSPPPMPEQQIQSLPTIQLNEKHEEKKLQCSVCLEDLKRKGKAKQLPCDHLYHEKCITPWLKKQSTCPNCRKFIEIEIAETKMQPNRIRRFQGFSSIEHFFTTSMNPFRYPSYE